MRIADVLRKAIKEVDGSLYSVSQGAEIAYPTLYRFYHGQRSLKLESVEKLADFLGLELVRKRGKASKTNKRGG